jgi:ABC-type glycerol-3-phosphate transport system substrate-binding protein
MRKKSILVVLAALLFILTALPVWSGGSSARSSSASSAWPKVTVGFAVHNYALRETEGTGPTDIFSAFREKLEVDLQFIGYPDNQALDLAIAAGDLPDLLHVGVKSYMTQLLRADLVQPMDDYLKYAPNLVSSSPLRIAASRKYYSKDGDGKLYFITPQVGQEAQEKSYWNGMTIRWDYYKEAGYPEVKNEDDFLRVVADIVARHPTTPDGKKTYGVATFTDDSLWGWYIRSFFYGFINIGPNYSLGYSKTEPGKIDRVVSNLTDYDSPIWRDIEYYRKANKLGILDPDTLIMAWDDMNQKSNDGQIVAPACAWLGGDLYTIERAKDPNTMTQFMVLPMEGQYNYVGSKTDIGWNMYYSITKKAKNVESIMKILDYLSTPDGARFAYNGPQGKVWDVINGKPQIKPEAVAMQTRGGTEWTVFGEGLWDAFIFISPRSIASDGGMANLWNDPALWQSTMSPAEKDFNSHYGVTYPAEAAVNLVNQGKAWDRSGQLNDLMTLLPAPTQEIQRIDAACVDIMVRAIPRLVLASDAEYETLKTQLQRDLQSANVQTSINWWMAAEREGKTFLNSVK